MIAVSGEATLLFKFLPAISVGSYLKEFVLMGEILSFKG